jgi:hypothetical protein
MFDTISEFNAAMGTWGFGAGFAAGGGVGLAAAGDGLNGAGAGFMEGLVGLEDVVLGGAAFVWAVGAGGGLDAVEVVDGFDTFVGSADGGAALGYCSRSLFNIFDDSGETGVLTVGFAGTGEGFCDVAVPRGLCATFAAAGVLAMGLDTGFSTTGGFADGDAFATGVFGPAFVDFALVVDFLVASGISTSTGSEMTFLGLPLFFTASADMLTVELGWEELPLSADSQRGNCEDRRGVILEDLMARRQFWRVLAEVTSLPPLFCDLNSTNHQVNRVSSKGRQIMTTARLFVYWESSLRAQSCNCGEIFAWIREIDANPWSDDLEWLFTHSPGSSTTFIQLRKLYWTIGF